MRISVHHPFQVWLHKVMTSEVYWALSSVNPLYNPHHLPNRGVVGHNINRRDSVCMWHCIYGCVKVYV